MKLTAVPIVVPAVVPALATMNLTAKTIKVLAMEMKAIARVAGAAILIIRAMAAAAMAAAILTIRY